MIFGPLFKTGFLIEAFMRRNDWFGANQCVLTSASSKTAMALAHPDLGAKARAVLEDVLKRK